jgi:iron(III) transport system ATP-binding protein
MLELDSIRFSYGQTPVLKDVSFEARSGVITCLVGPSGCGKSTLLRLAAGLLPTQSGEIRIDTRLVAGLNLHVSPEQRSVGLVFQEGALFPHLNALQNIRFGLRSDARVNRVDELLEMTELVGLADRYPDELSGGQRQRVALARALAPEPRVLLFDEPYANLDQALSRQLREATRRLVAELDTVAVFVTHDSDDIADLADTVVAMTDGEIVQSGSPRELFDHPLHLNVARLFGQTQRLSAHKAGDRLETPFGPWRAECLAVPVQQDGPLNLHVRPDGLAATPDSDGLQVSELRLAGADDLVGVRGKDGAMLFVRVGRPHDIQPGGRVALCPLKARVFPQVSVD